MPRESVNSESPFSIKVGWPKGGHVRNDSPGVQVGVEGRDEDGQEPPFVSAWAHLDRQGCNDLIRLVRKARDDAFGPDQ